MSASSPAAGPTLWLLRHAPVLAAPGLCYGRTDLPADPAATRRAAETLALQLPRGTVVKTSPLQRCELLALDLQALRPDLAFKTDARLAEMDFGAWEASPGATFRAPLSTPGWPTSPLRRRARAAKRCAR